jgi:hypothetical protein
MLAATASVLTSLLGAAAERVVNEMMLSETVDNEFGTVKDVAEVALMLAPFNSSALTANPSSSAWLAPELASPAQKVVTWTTIENRL